MAQGKMLVNGRNCGRACCKHCNVEYGHSDNGNAKDQLRRANRRRGKRAFKKDMDNY